MNSVKLEKFSVSRGGSVDPSKHLEEVFDLYSIPAYDEYKPEIIAGREIGSAKKIVQPGDVLLSRIVPHIRRVWVVGPLQGRRQIGSGEWIVFRGDSFDPNYLRHILMADPFHQQFMRTVSGMGGSLLRARPSEVEKIKIPLPPLPEQKRIATILDKSDSIRRKRQEAVRLAGELASSAFLEMFGDPATNSKGWRVDSLDKHINFLTTGSRGWAEHYSSEGSRFIRSLDVQMNYISNDEVAYVNAPNGAEAKRTRVQPGDVLLTVTGSKIGRVAPVPKNIGDAYVSQHVAIIRTANTLLPGYLSMFLSLPCGGQRQILQSQYGQTKPGLNLDQIRGFKVPCPPIALQNQFVDFCERATGASIRFDKSERSSDGLFNSLMQRAFNGEL